MFGSLTPIEYSKKFLGKIDSQMKIIVIGLGNFGSVLSVRLTDMGHEIIGADTSMERVDRLKSKLSTTICLDAGKPESIQALPVNEVDLVIVAIGDNFAASVQAVAALKQLGVSRIIARSMTSLHTGVLQSLGVERVVLPEKDSAEILSQSLTLNGFVSSYRVDDDHYILQFVAPKVLVGQSIAETDIESHYQLQIITIKRTRQVRNMLSLVHSERVVTGLPTPDTVLQEGDVVVVYGKLNDYDHFTRSLRKISSK